VASLTATPGNKSIRVTWREPNDNRLEAYYIGISDGNAIAWSEYGAGTSLKEFSNLENGREYTIKIITLGLDESDQDNPKWYMSSGVTVKATPNTSADNTNYLPSITNFSATWDTSKECVVLTWTDVTDSHAEGYYFFATTTNTIPTAPSYNVYSDEYLEGHSNRVGDETISHGKTELWINDDDVPFQLAANTTYYIWAFTFGTDDDDAYIYSKWNEMPMATVTTGTSSSGNGGGIAEGG
ncbi:MAG: hypothetical protein II707_07805, partial [Spirochaetales bacterium]|nr:hypothetical protein [Spirochaetales bacterium]